MSQLIQSTHIRITSLRSIYFTSRQLEVRSRPFPHPSPYPFPRLFIKRAYRLMYGSLPQPIRIRKIEYVKELKDHFEPKVVIY